MKKVLVVLAALPVVVVVVFFAMGVYSGKGRAPGLNNGVLSPCSSKPNCVNSETGTDEKHKVAALTLSKDDEQEPLLAIKEAVEITGGEINSIDDQYLAATYTSSFFNFVDDVEFRLDADKQTVHVRSASRVGYSDWGANKKRVESLRDALKP